MSSSFAYSFDQYGGDSPFADGYLAPHFSNCNSTVAGGEFVSYPAYFSLKRSPILQPAAKMEHHESFALREWRRQNRIRLEEKEKREKALLRQILVEADKYKVEFQIKRQARCEAIKVTNRVKEQAFVATQEKFHADADKDYWKSIAEMIPKEVPKLKKQQRGKKAPGKPSDLSRMRQILLNLKHNTPPHLKLSPTPPDADADTSARA